MTESRGLSLMDEHICGRCTKKKGRDMRKCHYDTKLRKKVNYKSEGCENFDNKYTVE